MVRKSTNRVLRTLEKEVERQFYTSPTPQQNNSSTSSPSGTERGDEKKIGFAAVDAVAGNNYSAAPPNQREYTNVYTT